jgi:hypothetical protein
VDFDVITTLPEAVAPSFNCVKSTETSIRASGLDLVTVPLVADTLIQAALGLTAKVKEFGPPAEISMYLLLNGVKGSKVRRVGGGQLYP